MTIDEAIRIIKIVLVVAEEFEITVQGEEFTKEKCKEAVEIVTKALEQEPCVDAISRQAVLDLPRIKTHNHWGNVIKESVDIEDVRQLPPVTPAEKQQPCEDVISRQAAMDAFERLIHELGIEDKPYNYGEMALSIQNVPPATPQPKMGRWIEVTNGRGGHECDLCYEYAPSYQSGDEYLSQYCPNCGAKMQEVEE